jgi:zinc transport system permease protein
LPEASWSDFVASWSLFRAPILCAMVAGAALGYLSVFIVLRRMVFVTAALTQSAGLGIAMAFFVQIHWAWPAGPTTGAVGASLMAAALLSLPAERLYLTRDSVLALLWLAAAAGAVLLGDRIAQEAHDLAAILFGTAVLVRTSDLVLVSVVGLPILALAVLSTRRLVFAGFDPDGARVQGVPVRLLELGLLLGLSLVVSVSTRALGALPVFAFSVLPGLAALLATTRLDRAFPAACVAGIVAGGGGYLMAFFGNLPVGASQTAIAVVLVVLALPVRLLRGAG